MRSFLKFSAWTLLLVFIASAVMAAVLVGVAQEGLSDHGHWHVVVDGEDLFSSSFGSDSGWNFFGVLLGLAVAVFCVMVVVPLVLLLGVGLPLLGVMLVLAVVAVSLLGVAALLASPLLLPVLILVLLLKRAKRPQGASTVS